SIWRARPLNSARPAAATDTAIARDSGRATPRVCATSSKSSAPPTRPTFSSTIGRSRTRASCGCRSCGSSFRGERRGVPSRKGHAAPRGRAEAARGGIQHVFRRTAAEAAVGNAEPCRSAGEALRPRVHPEHRRSLPVQHAAVALRDVRRPLGSRPARARGRTAGTLRAAGEEADREAARRRGPHPARRGVPRSDARGRQAGRALSVAVGRSEEHTSELQSLAYLVCRLLLEKKNNKLYTEQNGA